MKKILLIMLAVSMGIVFTACEKNEVVDYAAGEIPGLGNTDGELTGRPFELPDGVTLTEEMQGGAEWSDYFRPTWDYSSMPLMSPLRGKELPPTKAFVTTRSDDIPKVYRGSGYGYVDIYVSLKNENRRATTVEFPAGLILENVAGDSQNGVLLKKTEVRMEANSEVLITLSFYCGNASRGSAHSGDYYTLGVVTNAAPLIDLCERLANKRINLEEFDPASTDDFETYYSQASMLQGIVWNVTDWGGLNQADIDYINSLPNSR